jgi:hypothetical protein
MQAAGELTEPRRAEYRATLDRVRQIERRHRDKGAAFAELHRISKWVADQWAGEGGRLLAP